MSTKLTFEECQALYFDSEALLEPTRTVYRLSGHLGGRYYYTIDGAGEVHFYISVTNKISKTMPTSPYLIDWIANMGREEARRYSQMRADYGTLMHIKFSSLLINKELDMTDLEEEVEGYLMEVKQPGSLLESWCNELRKDILAFAKFIHDYKVKPLAIEVVLASDKNGDAGAVDLLCKMTIQVDGKDPKDPYKSGPRKGEPRDVKVDKEITAIVDFKSGKKGFYEEMEIQLQDYKELVQENFTQFKDEEIRLYNFAPKDWKSAPDYKLKDQTDSPNLAKLPYLHELGKIELAKKKQTALRISGKVDLNLPVESLEENYEHVQISSLVKENHNRKDK